mgnify:CR=1 FL=1|tara:strand:+ start:851 stop:1342 length:492 start_codon:yes stop_codon:yes gene_type:complete
MIDPFTAMTAATTAFNLIKKGFAAGREIESMTGDLSKWMGAISDIKQAEVISKNPPLFKKLFFNSSIEKEAMDAFAAKKKAQEMEDELRTWINFTHGPNSWNELLQMQIKIRKQRQEMVYAQQERIRKITSTIGVIFAVLVLMGAVTGIAVLVIKGLQANGTI